MSIRPGWFWHEKEEPHSVERLVQTYLNSCGANASFHLNIPPMPSGRLDPRDLQRLQEFSEQLRARFGEDKKLTYTSECIPLNDTQVKYEITLPEEADIGYLEMREDLLYGQRIENFRITVNGNCIYRGRTVGHRKICQIGKKTTHLTVHITGARDTVMMRDITLYRKDG
jgi:alpha-L-fucosidase